MGPKFITSWTSWLDSALEVYGHTWVVYSYSTIGIVTNLALQEKLRVELTLQKHICTEQVVLSMYSIFTWKAML